MNKSHESTVKFLCDYLPLIVFFACYKLARTANLFIKIKPTIINLLFAAILFYGYFNKKLFLSHLLGEQIKMSDQSWMKLSARWGFFFLSLALLNEIIWRSFPTDFWVQFKVFGMMPISLIFTLSQMPFMMREMKNSQRVWVYGASRKPRNNWI